MRMHSPQSAGRGTSKKAAGARRWHLLVLESSGKSQVVEMGKQAIMRRTGLSARDLRILDPQVSHPSTMLGRERAIVINLEHIKAIVTAREEEEGTGDDPNRKELYDSGTTESKAPTSPDFGKGISHCEEIIEESKTDGIQSLENRDSSKVVPFEFVALEASLESACSFLQNEVEAFEQEVHPALDELISKITNLNLERVRQIKSRLKAKTKRARKVRDELEHLLDDHEDMAEMYLTEKLKQQQQQHVHFSTSSINERDDIDNEAHQANMHERDPAEISLEATGVLTSYEIDRQKIDYTSSADYIDVISKDIHGTYACISHATVSKYLDQKELQMILEAYLLQISGTLNKPSMLKDCVKDTEHYINILLNEQQNNLLQTVVRLATAGFMICALKVVIDTFGININNELFDVHKSGTPEFLWTAAGGTVRTLFLYVAAIAWFKYKRLLLP